MPAPPQYHIGFSDTCGFCGSAEQRAAADVVGFVTSHLFLGLPIPVRFVSRLRQYRMLVDNGPIRGRCIFNTNRFHYLIDIPIALVPLYYLIYNYKKKT